MLGNEKHIEVKYHLSNAADHLSIAFWTGEKYHADQARDYLLFALAGGRESARENLVDLIAGAIDDTIDIDWTSEQSAERIVDVLLDHVIPQVKGGDDQ